jgi:CBS domain containing-hemolysin-like protein
MNCPSRFPGLTVPDEAAYETVGGYVMSELGRIAAVGDTVPVEGGTLSVTRMDGRRIDRICYRPAKPESEAGGHADGTNIDRTNDDSDRTMSDWAGILWLVVLLLGNAFFVAAEFAVMSARRSQIEPLAEAGSKRAQTTLRAMENVSLMLACAQLGITVCSLLILLVAEPAIHHLMVVPLEAAGVPAEIADIAAFAVALLLVTFLHVTIGEMVPKNISVSVADKAALLLAPPLMFIARLVKPVIVALNWSANHILKLIRIEPKDEVNSSFTLEEVQSIVQESTRHGLVDDEAGLITGALEFSEYSAADIMVPLEKLVMLKAATTPVEFEKAVSRTGFSRFPMLDDDDMLYGYLHVKDVLSIPEAAYERPIAESRIRSLANLALDDEIEKAMSVMQRTGSHLARVIGPDGNTKGVLFLEDVIEQLVGEIRDATQARGVRRLGQPNGA